VYCEFGEVAGDFRGNLRRIIPELAVSYAQARPRLFIWIIRKLGQSPLPQAAHLVVRHSCSIRPERGLADMIPEISRSFPLLK
jgi:hypothetical protein